MRLIILKVKLSQNKKRFVISTRKYNENIYVDKQILGNLGYVTPEALVNKVLIYDELHLKINDGWLELFDVLNVEEIDEMLDDVKTYNGNFSQTKNQLVDIDETLENNPVYKKMLNNLLGIGVRDNATFASSKANNIDLIRMVSSNDFEKIFSKGKFSLTITNSDIDNTIYELSNSQDLSTFIDIADSSGVNVSIADRKLLENNFQNHKNRIITKIMKQKNKKVAKWKRFRNKYMDQQVRTNSWPLFLGTMFIKVVTHKTKLYAPLLLKKVMINISNKNKITIETIDGGVEVNEKLLFLLQDEYKFNLPKIINEKDIAFENVIETYMKALKDLIEPINFKSTFITLTKNSVTNQTLEYSPGVALTICSPTGGELRDKLIDLFKSSDMDNILKVDMLKDLMPEISSHLEQRKGIFRITPTDLSQEKAIIGSLMDHSIIWGPPGTGKSQTISNILANIMVKNSSVIITSEKKAALDVISNRMKKLSKFIFFGLTDKNVDKVTFYKPFQEMINKVTKQYEEKDFDCSSIITNNEWSMLDKDVKLSRENVGNIIKVNNLTSDQYVLNYLLRFHSTLKNNKDILSNVSTKSEWYSGLEQNNVKKNIFRRYPRNIRKIQKIAKHLDNNYELLNYSSKINDMKHVINFEEFLKIENAYKNDSQEFKNDEYIIERLLTNRFREKLKMLRMDPEHKKQTQSFMRACQSAWALPYKFVDKYKIIINELFNVFVSTPQTLASSIDMNKQYDYVIFDEASQLHLEKAIPFISMADVAIIAGDTEQMRPTTFFGIRDNSELDEEVEEDVDSLLDYALRKGLGKRQYMLNKNYRSNNSELMMFSSKEFYKSDLDVIDNNNKSTDNSVDVYDVGGKWENRINHKEALMSLEKILEESENYKKIILLTFNSTQKQYIDSLIYNNERYNAIIDLIEEERVYLRNLENIQGDEADLVIISVAYDKNAKLGSTYVARPEGKSALNVAISRAIDKMIVFKSISSSEVITNIKNDSLRVFKEWLSYLELDTKDRKQYTISSHKDGETFDSTFEEDVYDYLLENIRVNKGLYIKTQYSVGSYRIDMAIIDSKTHKFIMGIEVDGYRWHSGFKKMSNDIERQRFIEAKGYAPIYRITELNWKIDKNKVLKEIQVLLED